MSTFFRWPERMLVVRLALTAAAVALLTFAVLMTVMPAPQSRTPAPAPQAVAQARLLSSAVTEDAAAPAGVVVLTPVVLAAPAGLRASTGTLDARVTWDAVSGASVYELRIGGAGGAGTGTTRFDRVLPAALRHGAVIQLGPGRYTAIVRAGLSARDVHGHWSAALAFQVPAPHVVLTVAVSSLAARAYAWALTQEGKWYGWGGTGPSTYDCSGLVMVAYLHAGLSLPRTTYEMLASWHLHRTYHPVKGDLAFYGSGHVELYAGGEETFGAHQTGERIGFVHEWEVPVYFHVA